jgi:hypothetical protein
MKRLPSEYWATNCFAGCSPPARAAEAPMFELDDPTLLEDGH